MIRRSLYLSLSVAVCFWCFASTSQGADRKARKKKQVDPKTKVAFLDADSAGADFLIQSEYEGTTAYGDGVGIQVIARGDGKFDAVVYGGGLPGAGWDGETCVPGTGETADGVVRFKFEEGQAEINEDVFSGEGKYRGENIRVTAKKVLRKSPTLGAEAPQDAIVLFDGTNVESWKNGKLEEGGLLGVGTRSKEVFENFRLHLEFRTPFMPYATGQGRGNSGMYLLDQYECQILDSFGLEGKDNECGGIYKVARPQVNMCFPPLSWQTYDVEFHAAQFDAEGKKTANAVATIRHNGVAIHENLELSAVTPGGGRNDERPGALYLQDHHNPVRFRNIWVVPTKK